MGFSTLAVKLSQSTLQKFHLGTRFNGMTGISVPTWLTIGQCWIGEKFGRIFQDRRVGTTSLSDEMMVGSGLYSIPHLAD